MTLRYQYSDVKALGTTMTVYNPPIQAMFDSLKHHGDCENVLEQTGSDFDIDLIYSIIDESGKLARDVIAPTNREGDLEGSVLDKENHTVTTPKSFKNAYAQYRDAGWNAVPFPEDYGGQGLPSVVSFAVQEFWQASNLSFGLCPLLNQGAVEAILEHGSDEQKEKYLPKLVSGEWTGTMNLTEPQAGSDLSAVATKAEPNGEHYKISGQKIYITYGEHDLADNIIHLVLARLPDAPEGVKGISLFIVPKVLDDRTRNNVKCVGLEHKLGIHASPTAVMQYDAAIGYLVGQANEGLKYMFTMMNNARLSVGLQGVAVSERAYQQAVMYAEERTQGFPLTSKEGRVTIDYHPDVQRMLLKMKSLIFAGRALTYWAASNLDKAKDNSKAQIEVDLLTPMVKAWCTDLSETVTSLNIQVHGGMGFVEEKGAAQLYRDARILPIYEGTNGIQANDLMFRKTIRDQGEMALGFIQDMTSKVEQFSHKDLEKHTHHLQKALSALKTIIGYALEEAKNDPNLVAAVAYDYLQMFSVTAAGYVLLRAANKDPEHYKTYQSEIDYFTFSEVSKVPSLLDVVQSTGAIVLNS